MFGSRIPAIRNLFLGAPAICGAEACLHSRIARRRNAIIFGGRDRGRGRPRVSSDPPEDGHSGDSQGQGSAHPER
ncbi:hypothetical protein B0H67DRAFT_569549 [Lasiosphaeris hirsuta]|uniref:Uncharacterized protein n=1 Tax=Lasiosphaeris hirsuta TaxID=260670 RepID=A0AA40B021_9PEZI|nr:hypothetical protein B0H67DRAFT_569549 [Lasiosphaeris hirsuta]